MRKLWAPAAMVVGLAALCWIAAPAAAAEDVRAEASVDARNVAVGDNLTLTITVYGASNVSPPDMSSLEGFQVLGSYSSQSVSIVNARMTRSISLQYTLMATAEGDHTLGPFTVTSGKNAYQTEPIAVRVVKAGAGAGAGQGAPPAGAGQRGRAGRREASDLSDLVRAFATVDRKTAYVGEQVTYTMTFAYRTQIDNVAYLEPDHTGFWFEDVGETAPEIRVMDGVKYYAITKVTAFFPISSGQYTIGEGGVRYLARGADAFSRDPFSFFGRDPFDALRGREGTAKADPIRIDVLPLPTEGRPSDFSGAVGSFLIKVSPSANEVRVGESLTLSVKIEGQGNVKSIADIPLPRIEGFRVFAPKSRDSLRVDGTRVGGAKIFDLVLVPERVGTQVLEGFGLSYFDPAKRAYVRTSAAPVQIRVLEGDEATMRALAASGGESRLRKQDIRYIKAASGVTNELSLSLDGFAGLAAKLLPIGIVLVGLALSLQRRRAERSGRAGTRRAAKALARNLERAAGAEARGDSVGASTEAARAIRKYIAHRLGTSEAAVDGQVIAGVGALPEESRARVIRLLERLDAVRFAPVGSGLGETGGLVAEAEALMSGVDQQWRE